MWSSSLRRKLESSRCRSCCDGAEEGVRTCLSRCAVLREAIHSANFSPHIRRGGRVVEGARLLSGCTANPVPRVQIPPSPFLLLYPPNNKILQRLLPLDDDIASIKRHGIRAACSSNKRYTKRRNGKRCPSEFHSIGERNQCMLPRTEVAAPIHQIAKAVVRVSAHSLGIAAQRAIGGLDGNRTIEL